MHGRRPAILVALAWPLRRFFWPQFAWTRATVEQTERRLHDRLDAMQAVVERRLDDTAAGVREVLQQLGDQEGVGLRREVAELRAEVADLRFRHDCMASMQAEIHAVGLHPTGEGE